MSLPVEIDWALIKAGDGESPEVFTLICGIVDVTINQGANTSDRAVRDCDAPGAVPFRKTKVSSKQLDISGTGLSNTQEEVRLNGLLATLNNYQVELYREGPTDAGVLLGTYSGEFRMTAKNISAVRDNPSSMDIALASNGQWTYTDAAGS